MPPPYRKHVFVCLHSREGNKRPSCAPKGSEEILHAIKEALRARGLSNEIRANKAGCLDNCEEGCSVVVYPEGVWYGHVQLDDVADIVDQHLVGGTPVERIRLAPPKPETL